MLGVIVCVCNSSAIMGRETQKDIGDCWPRISPKYTLALLGDPVSRERIGSNRVEQPGSPLASVGLDTHAYTFSR